MLRAPRLLVVVLGVAMPEVLAWALIDGVSWASCMLLVIGVRLSGERPIVRVPMLRSLVCLGCALALLGGRACVSRMRVVSVLG